MSHTLSPLFTWRSAIIESDLPPKARHVGLTLSLYMNEAGSSAFPSIVTLCRNTGCGKATVVDALKKLADEGWITVHKHAKGPGRGHFNAYTAAIPERVLRATLSQERVLEEVAKGSGIAAKGSASEPEDVEVVELRGCTHKNCEGLERCRYDDVKAVPMPEAAA